MRQLKLERSVWSLDEQTLLGRPGGFGSVHPGVAEDGTPVAIKLLRSDIGDATHRELDFARAFLGRDTHHVIPILDLGNDLASGRACLVMPRAERSLRDHLKAGAAITETEAVLILLEIARGLLEVDDWVHRDLKPENVLRYGNRWNVADFGIARLTEAKTSLRTLKDALSPPYAAPEQWDGQRTTHATDVYALGCIGAELLSGRPLYSGPDMVDYAEQHRGGTPLITAGSPRIRTLLLRMVAKPALARPQTEKVLAQLASIQARPNGSGPGAAALGEASALIADATARAEAAQAEAEAMRRQRKELAACAFTEMSSIAERLSSEIKEHAPQANIRETSNRLGKSFEIKLAGGTLTITVGHFSEIRPDEFTGCGWDVICGDMIVVRTSGYERSASLWYANLGDGSYRWVETAYWCWSGNPSSTPCHLPPGRDARLAAAVGMHNWQLAHPIRAIESEEQLDAFCQRWMNFLSQAAVGKLARPGRLPEE
jgi:serine/threonine protein kinase